MLEKIVDNFLSYERNFREEPVSIADETSVRILRRTCLDRDLESGGSMRATGETVDSREPLSLSLSLSLSVSDATVILEPAAPRWPVTPATPV